jgi:hypothetical protein
MSRTLKGGVIGLLVGAMVVFAAVAGIASNPKSPVENVAVHFAVTWSPAGACIRRHYWCSGGRNRGLRGGMESFLRRSGALPALRLTSEGQPQELRMVRQGCEAVRKEVDID